MRRERGSSKQGPQKLEDNYFQDWPAGTELGREGFKRLMHLELRKYILEDNIRCTLSSESAAVYHAHCDQKV